MKLSLRSEGGLTTIELIVSLAILTVLTIVVLTSLISFKKNQSLSKDSGTVVEVLRQARNQTLSSKNSSNYGVHMATTTVTLFAGSSYSSGASTNQDFLLSSTDTILTISLAGGESNVVFNRLTGETAQNGTVVISSPDVSETKTVTIYKTGLIEFQ